MTNLLLLGLDAATWDVIDEGIAQGKMPFFQTLKAEGAYGTLESTNPPRTCPAWPCFMTGKNPGKLGFYGFRSFESDYSRQVRSFADLPATPYWDYLAEDGRTNGVLNVPVTWPPRIDDGFMVSGLMTPSSSPEDGNFAVPDRLEDDLRDSDFTLEPVIDDYSEDEFRRLARDLLETRVDVTLDLAEHEEWDVLTTVIRITDPYKHKFWREGNKKEIVEFYEDVDREVKRLVEGVRDESGEKVNLLVVSDHGFGRVDHTLVHFNRWLADEGYLELEDTTANLWKKYLPLDVLYNIATKLGLKNVRNLAPDAVVGARSGFQLDIDWENTDAIAQFVEETGLIYINRSDRFDDGAVDPDEYEDVRQEIIDGLRTIEDPDTGERVIREIKTREEVYEGAYLDEAPDILFKMTDGYRGRDSIDSRFSNMAAERRYAAHTPDGIVLAHGPDMADTGEIDEKSIYDVAPTVLHLMGSAVPDDMDGDVMTDLFAAGSDPAEREVERRQDLSSSDETGDLDI